MTGADLRLAWYGLRAGWRRRLGGYVALALLIALVGGLAMGSLIAARRTDASYPDYLAKTNPSDLLVQPTTTLTCSSGFLRDIARLRGVRHVGCITGLEAATITPGGGIGTILLTRAELVASSDGMFSRQDRLTVTAGRAANPSRADEVVVNAFAASYFHLHVGSHLRVGVDTVTQANLLPAHRLLDLRVVGIGAVDIQVVQDDIDKGHTGFLVGTPALARQLGGCCTELTYVGLQLDRGSGADPAVEDRYAHLIATSPYTRQGGQQLQIYDTASIEAEAQRAIRPEAIALGVFGVIAALALFLVALQSMGRQLRDDAEEAEVMRALGAGPGTIVGARLLGLGASVVTGALAAAVVAAALSPLALFGPVAAVEPFPGLDLDWTVLGSGVAAILVVLGGLALVTAWRRAPHRLQRDEAEVHGSRAVHLALSSGLRPPAVVGLRFALEPGRGRATVPVRSVVLGAVLAVAVVVVATVTFGASLDTLVSHPTLYGWNFDDALYSTDGYGPVALQAAAPLLAHDRSVAATTPAYFATVEIDGQAVPAMAMADDSAILPPVLQGHGLRGAHQLLLGPATLAQLHARIGDVVMVAGDSLPPMRLTIVGTTTLPAIGTTLGVHPSMGTGALFALEGIPASVRQALLQAYGSASGPPAIFVRFRPGTSPTAGTRSLDGVLTGIERFNDSPSVEAAFPQAPLLDLQVLGVQRPAEIVNYRSMGTTPAVLAGGLALGAVVALALTLVASVRRRRHELALLKGLGFTGGQLGEAVAWQATTVAVLGALVGLPVGIVVGRWLWGLFADGLSAVSDPTVPLLTVAVVVLATLVLANAVATLPGRLAARTPTARLLRVE